MASFIENSLVSGETVEQKAGVSWLSQFWLYLLAVFFMTNTYTMIFSALLILLAIMNISNTELAITNKKVIGRTGFLKKESVDMPIDRLESINIEQGLIGRILGYGKVKINGIGGNTVTIPFIKGPFAFRKAAINLLEKKPVIHAG